MHQTSCSYTPQQNGVIEQKHRHLLETTRALFHQSKLPEKFWGECVLCVAYLINRIPLVSIGNVTPYERVYKEPPILEHLRIFGCLCFVSTTKVNRSKLDHRASPSVFIGYPATQKGYKVLDLKSQQIQVSRDVIFHEQHFPYHMLSSQTSESQYHNAFFLPYFTASPSFYFDDDIAAQTSVVHTISPDQTNDSSSTSDHQPTLRQSTRVRQPPSYLSYYHCNSSQFDKLHFQYWCNLVTFDHTPSSHKAFSF